MNIRLTVHSTHCTDGETREQHMAAAGLLTEKENGVCLSFRENEGADAVRTRLHIEDGGRRVRVVRHGAAEGELRFEKDIPYSGEYAIAPAVFRVSLRTRELYCHIKEGKGEIRIVYEMDMGGAAQTVTYRLRVRPCETGKECAR